ncbi:MAG: succinate dehydrogenase assembly factor 2 [Pseudomonadota bacterium]|nr:succinate dehydrogenase assembly factor 2 [Pseudomonadota bacterium]MEE3099039.1 succinate dehydrogenase assembly factor 2 [Pseudomonadota bacterium]
MTDAASRHTEAEARLRRLRIRGWRRGTKEMDMILGPFCDALAEGRATCDLDALEALMEENDQDLYLWVSGAVPTPPAHAPMIAGLRDFHGIAPRR